MSSESTPLLANGNGVDHHDHFCMLLGILPYHTSNASDISQCKPLYQRAMRRHKAQNFTYNLTAALSNSLLLTQVVFGAVLTALGASSASYKLITVFEVMNTIIAGLVAYLKSRGQPMRARMFRDHLEEVVDEIEDSRVMWLGIKHGVHEYDEIDIEDKVSVRSEVARLTRMYDGAVKKYMENNPDLYNTGGKPKEEVSRKSRVAAAAQTGNDAPATDQVEEEGPATASDEDEGKGRHKANKGKEDEDSEPAPALAEDDQSKGKEDTKNESPATMAGTKDSKSGNANANNNTGATGANTETNHDGEGGPSAEQVSK